MLVFFDHPQSGRRPDPTPPAKNPHRGLRDVVRAIELATARARGAGQRPSRKAEKQSSGMFWGGLLIQLWSTLRYIILYMYICLNKENDDQKV